MLPRAPQRSDTGSAVPWPRGRKWLVGGLVAGLGLVLAAIGWWQYTQLETVAPVPVPASTGFHCDGRLRCSEMRSCEEAKFFLKNCPGTQSYMDVDQDRLPCEQALCPQE